MTLMGPRKSIYKKILSVIGMSKPSLNVRFSQAILDQLDELVESEQYASKADIVNQAVIEFLQREGLRPIIREEIRKELGRE